MNETVQSLRSTQFLNFFVPVFPFFKWVKFLCFIFLRQTISSGFLFVKQRHREVGEGGGVGRKLAHTLNIALQSPSRNEMGER